VLSKIYLKMRSVVNLKHSIANKNLNKNCEQFLVLRNISRGFDKPDGLGVSTHDEQT
jgi:hypothetical protein